MLASAKRNAILQTQKFTKNFIFFLGKKSEINDNENLSAANNRQICPKNFP